MLGSSLAAQPEHETISVNRMNGSPFVFSRQTNVRRASHRRYTLSIMAIRRLRMTVGVGMTITSHPLHRSGRALLTHPAPALGDDAKSPERIRVMQRGRWQPAVNQTVHLLPRQPPRLAATPKRPVPLTSNMKA